MLVLRKTSSLGVFFIFVKMEKDYFSNLSLDEKNILKNKETESPFSGEYNKTQNIKMFAIETQIIQN